MPFPFQVAVITGASSGIGQALTLELARHGCKLGLVARRGDLLDQLAGKVRTDGGVAETASADVADRAALVAAVHRLTDRLGPVDLLIANAGVGSPMSVEPFNTEAVERTIRVNYFGVVYSIEAVLPAMLARGLGHVAAVSSLGAYKGLPGEQAYTASKAAVNNFLEGLRIQLHGRGVHVTTINPGFVRTPMTDANNFAMPFLMEPEEAARRIVRALRRRVKVYDFPWQTSLLMKLARWLPDWVLSRMMSRYAKPEGNK